MSSEKFDDSVSALSHFPYLIKLTKGQLGQIPPLYEVIRLQKDLPQPRLANRVIFQVKLVEALERVLVRVHVEGID